MLRNDTTHPIGRRDARGVEPSLPSEVSDARTAARVDVRASRPVRVFE